MKLQVVYYYQASSERLAKRFQKVDEMTKKQHDVVSYIECMLGFKLTIVDTNRRSFVPVEFDRKSRFDELKIQQIESLSVCSKRFGFQPNGVSQWAITINK